MEDIKQAEEMPKSSQDIPVVEFKSVNKYFGKLHVLKDINLSIKAGEVVVIIGPSGSGKSTLCRTINRLETIDSGSILLDGEPLPQEGKALAAMRSRIGMVFQSFNLFAHKSILDNVCMAPIAVLKRPKDEVQDEALKLLKRVGVEAQAHKVPAQLSGGQQQRVAIARALANNPSIMLCDEATSALDSTTTAQILDLLRRINRDLNVTLVIITHSLAVARNICDRVAMIDGGKIVEIGDTSTLFKNPQSNILKTLIANENVENHRDNSKNSEVK